MEHPLIPSLQDLTAEELNAKMSELNNKLSIAYRMGNAHLCDQIRMALESYQYMYQEKTRKAAEGGAFGDIIDIS